MQIQDKRIFVNGGMNYDDTQKNIPIADTGYCFNIIRRSANTGNLGVIENIKGNTLIKIDLPSGINKVIGSVNDNTEQTIFYFVYNSNDNHSIFQYNTRTNTIKLVLQHKALNFQLSHPITSGNVVDNYLSFTDNYNEPREIDYEKAIKYTESIKYFFTDNKYLSGKVGFIIFGSHDLVVGDKIYIVQNDGFTNQNYEGLTTVTSVDDNIIETDKYFGLPTPPEGGYIFKYNTNKNKQYYKITDKVLNAIKYPDLSPPTAKYEQDETKKYNNLRGLLFQFRYRYVYDDNAKSVLSFASKVALPDNEQYITGLFNNDISINNTLRVSFSTGSDEVKSIEIFVRSGNTGNWVLYNTINKYDESGNILVNSNTYYEYLFYNESRGLAQDQIDIERLFDYVPQKAMLQEVIEANRKIYSNIVEGYNNVEIDVALTLKDEYLPQFVDTSQLERNWYNGWEDLPTPDQGWFFQTPYLRFFRYKIPDDININESLIISIELIRGDISKQQTFIINYVVTSVNKNVILNEIYQRLRTLLISFYEGATKPPSGEWADIFLTTRITNNNYYIYIIDGYGISINVFKSIKSFKFSYPCFKKGIYHNFGIVYYDSNGRCGAVNTSNESRIYMPTLQEGFNTLNQPNVFLNYYPYQKIEWEIRHQPPVWAKDYAWVKTKPTREFIQWYFDASTEANQIYTDTDGYQRIKINQNIINFLSKTPNSTLQGYTWTKGDRIKFMYYRYKDNNNELYILDYQDWEIIKYDETSQEIICNGIDVNRYTQNRGIYVFAEIYRDIKEVKEDLQYFEIGELLPVIYPYTSGRAHSGLTQAQNILQGSSAKGVFDTGDCYVKLRLTTFPNVIVFPVEEFNFSDYYQSDTHDYGRPNIIIKNIKQQRLQIVRHSLKYIENSQVNGFNTFYPLDYETMEAVNGDIYGLKRVGNVLKVLQKNKNTSIYINVKELSNADGSKELVATDKVLGTQRASIDNYGTSDYNSVVSERRYLYFYDIKTGEVVRDAANGMESISHRENIKMRNYFDNLKQRLIEANTYKVMFAYDGLNDLLLCTFNYTKDNVNISETIAFSEKENRWISFYAHYRQTNTGVDFIDNYAYIDNTLLSFIDGECYLHNNNNLYNNFYGVQHNSDIVVFSNKGQELIKVFDNINISSNDKNWYSDEITIGEMLSKLYKNHFVEKEKMLYSEFKRNINTPMIINNIEYRLLNGERLRGDVLKIKLTNDSKNLVILYSVIIKSNLSNRNYIN